MKIKMLEFYQGRDNPTLAKGNEYEVGEEVNQRLADWLLEHNKAVDVTPPEPKEKPQVKEPDVKPVKRARKPRGRAKK